VKITAKSHPEIVRIAKYAYPEYKGRKFFLEYKKEVDTSYNANWCEGTRTYYTFVRLDNGATMNPPDVAPWNRDKILNAKTPIPNGAVCVTNSFFCGHDCGITVIFPEQNKTEKPCSDFVPGAVCSKKQIRCEERSCLV
jgi:hypothetical protein